MTEFRVGTGYDIHRLEPGRPLIIGGVDVPCDRGAVGHSDADVLMHAVVDALLGAIKGGDIGRLFPDIDPRWKNADSALFVRDAMRLVRERGWEVANVDTSVVLQEPKLRPYTASMEANLADALGIDADRVNVKAKTNESVDATGEGRAIACHAVVLLRPAT